MQAVLERRVPEGEGTIRDYVLQGTPGVSPNIIQALADQSAESVITTVFLPIASKIYIHHEERFRPRLREVFNTWQGEEITRRGEFFRTLAALPPFASKVRDLRRENDDSNLENDQRIIWLISLLFEREELLAGLSGLQPELAEPNESSLTAIRRSVSALSTKVFVLKDENLTRRPEERAQMIAVLAPFVSSPVLSNEARTEIAELTVKVTPEEGHDPEVPIDFWWIALNSNDSNISGRAIRRIAQSIDSHQAESIAEVERLVVETGITDESSNIWKNFSRAVESLSFLPEQETDGIFQILVQKILAMEKQPEIRYRFGLADVCKTINTLLYYAYFRGRTEELMKERDALQFVDKLLDLYIPIKNDVNIRGPILNLLFIVLIRTYPNLHFGKDITEKIRTAVDNLQLFQGPPQDVPLDLIGELLHRKFEKESIGEFWGV